MDGSRSRGYPKGRIVVLFFVLALLAGWLAAPIHACTNIVLRNGKRVVFGSNLDWNIEGGLVFVNQRSMLRRSIVDPNNNNRATWVSHYGSVTFNQAGRDLPMDGINEAGLIVASMWLDDAQYPKPDERPAVDNAEWIQYQLDTAASVSDVISSEKEIRIAGPAPLHYLVADRTGAVATIEFLDGRMMAHTGNRLPVAALTNSTYDVSLQSIEGKTFHSWSWWPWGLPWGRASLDRFFVAAGRVQQFQQSPREDDVDYAFATLRSVGQGGATPTQWSIVYELTPQRMLVHFRTRQNSEIKTIDLSRLEFKCSGSAEWMDIQREAGGDVSSNFQPYTYEKNLELVRSTFSQIDFLRNLPESVVEGVAKNPSASRCSR